MASTSKKTTQEFRASRVWKYKNSAYTDRPKRKKWRPGGRYISNGGQEYEIVRDGPFYKIQKYLGGNLPQSLRGSFRRYQDAEVELIAFLKRTDKNGYARYPKKESRYGPFNGE